MSKLLSAASLVAFSLAFFAFTNHSTAGLGPPTIKESFYLKPDDLAGETCRPAIEPCAVISDTSFTLVSEVPVFAAKPGDIRVDFCTEYSDPDPDGLICRVVVDGNLAEPGDIEFSGNNGGNTTEDQARCFSWFASVKGSFKFHTIQVRCRKIVDQGPSINIENFTHSVFFNLF